MLRLPGRSGDDRSEIHHSTEKNNRDLDGAASGRMLPKPEAEQRPISAISGQNRQIASMHKQIKQPVEIIRMSFLIPKLLAKSEQQSLKSIGEGGGEAAHNRIDGLFRQGIRADDPSQHVEINTREAQEPLALR